MNTLIIFYYYSIIQSEFIRLKYRYAQFVVVSVKLSLHDGMGILSQRYDSIFAIKRAVIKFYIFGIRLCVLSPFILLSKNKEYEVQTLYLSVSIKDGCKTQLSLVVCRSSTRSVAAIVEISQKNEEQNRKNRKTLYHNVFSHYFWKCQTKFNISLRIFPFEKD